MTDNEIVSTLMDHDKSIEVMAKSVEHLAGAVGDTNKKLDGMIEVMGTQNVLIERMNNLDSNLKEYSIRMYKRVETIEKNQDTVGCAVVKELSIKVEDELTKIASNSEDIKNIQTRLEQYVSASTIKWFMGISVGYLVIFGTYLVTDLHRVDTELNTLEATQSIVNRNISEYVKSLDSRMVKHQTVSKVEVK